jgi:hypothetical protein
MATSIKFNIFTEDLARGIHDLDSHVFKIALSNTEPNINDTVLSDITQISAGNGYATGGNVVSLSISSAGGIASVLGTQTTFTANTGSIGAFRYAVLYNDSDVNDALIAYWDYGTSLSLLDGDSVIIKHNNTSPGLILTIG